LCASCGSSSKFAKATGENKGDLLISANLDVPVMTAAVKYGFKRMKITFDKEVKSNDNTVQILGTLKSSMQDWGQHFKVTIEKGASGADIYYLAQPRVAMNVTADVAAIRNNFLTYVSNYIEAAKEGIDLNTVEANK
jgi:hypothetical protein